MPKTITEAAREIEVVAEADVVVVGGGPGGVGAAIAAARSGASTVLVERYGHLGGMASGGLINIFPNLSDISGKQHIFGLTQEIIDRVDRRGGASYPRQEDRGSDDPELVAKYRDASLNIFCVRPDLNAGGRERVLYTAFIDPEILKDELNTMVLEAGADLRLHSWGTRPVTDGDAVKGVYLESKSGRQAILGRVVIDATGDGDIFVEAGAEFDAALSNKRRTAWLAFTFWLANVDIPKVDEFKAAHPEEHTALMTELSELGGYPRYFKGLLENQRGVLWYHCFQPQPQTSDAKDVTELTRIDITGRRRALITAAFMRKNVPGFEECFVMQTAPQLGIQGGRRISGEYTLDDRDMVSDEVFPDTIAVLPNNDNGEISAKHPALCVPYRCLVPKRVEGLLVAGRAFSSTDSVNQFFNIIPPCIAYGQAAGTAAALAVAGGIPPRKVDYRRLHDALVGQGVNLPEINK